MVSKKRDKIIIYKCLFLYSANINLYMLKAFSFVDIDIIFLKTSLYLSFLFKKPQELSRLILHLIANLGQILIVFATLLNKNNILY